MKTSEAVRIFGGHAPLAEALGITRQAIYLWGEDVPELRAYQIKELIRERKPS